MTLWRVRCRPEGTENARATNAGRGPVSVSGVRGDHAIGALVPAVAELAQALFGPIAFEVGAGQIVEQDLEAGIEE